jgi:hypothetical protein
MLARVLLGDDLCAGRMQPFIAVGMVEVPVRIDEMGDGIGAEGLKSFGDLRRDTPMPASISTLPSEPVRTAMLPPEPSNALMLFRSLCVTMGDTAALSLIRLTRPRASANAWRGVSHPAVAVKAAPPTQHRQKPRRDNKSFFEESMSSSLSVPMRDRSCRPLISQLWMNARRSLLN